MAMALPAVMIASAAISAYGAIQQGRAAQAAANYQAEIASQNAQLAREEGQDLLVQQNRENFLRQGAIRAAAGSTGLEGGSLFDILGDAAAQGELQKQHISRAAAIGERNQLNQARLLIAEGQNARTQSYYRAGSELLGGAANAGMAQYRLRGVA